MGREIADRRRSSVKGRKGIYILKNEKLRVKMI